MPPTVAALIPAAGQSRRMGCGKLLLPLPDRPVIVRCLETLHLAGIRRIVLVVGEPYGSAIREVAVPFGATFAWNHDPASDMAQSLRIGLPLLPPSASGILVVVPDYPLVQAATLSLLLARHDADPAAIIIPTWQERSGHPILVPAAVLARLPDHPTLRDLIRCHAGLVQRIPTPDPWVTRDMDTPADYRELQAGDRHTPLDS